MKDDLVGKIERTVRVHEMIPKEGKLIAGVSGGADSMAMLHFFQRFLPKERILVCHVNHGIRGEEAQRDEEFVRDYCKVNSLSFELLKTDIPALAKARGQSEEECGREERYRFFSSFISGSDDRIATAHTRTDLIETVLFRMVSGSALRGLSGIPAVRGAIIRPLIDLTREEVRQYCEENGVSYLEDSTNEDGRYPRNYIRAEILPKLEALNPNVQAKIAALATNAARDEAFLSKLAREAAEDAKIQNGYDTAKVLSLEDPVLLRLIRFLAEENGAKRVTEKQLIAAKSVLQSGGNAEFTGDLSIAAGQGSFRFLKKEELSFEGKTAFPLQIGASAAFPGGVFETELIEKNQIFPKKTQNIHNLLFTDAIDYDIITQDLVVRTRLAGDYFVSRGNSVRKPLRRFLSEKKVPKEMRDRLLLIANGSEVLFLEGFGACERARIGETTRKAVLIKIQRGNENV